MISPTEAISANFTPGAVTVLTPETPVVTLA